MGKEEHTMPDFTTLTKHLTDEGFRVSYFETAAQARDHLDRTLDGVSIGFGGSQTVREMGLFEQLSTHNTCIWHWDKEKNVQPKEATEAQVYICSVNGVAETGEIINIDGAGNRVSSTLFGHEKVILLVGKNKIAPDYDAALWRARNIAGPLNARRLEKKTPCAVGELKCHNCKSPDRICAALVVFWEKPSLSGDMEVVLINEDLGF